MESSREQVKGTHEDQNVESEIPPQTIRTSWNHRQYTIPPKEALDTVGAHKKQAVYSSSDVTVSLDEQAQASPTLETKQHDTSIQEENITTPQTENSITPRIENTPQTAHQDTHAPISLSSSSSSPGLLLRSSLTDEHVKRSTKGNVLQASLEFGISGISVAPASHTSPQTAPPSPPPLPPSPQSTKSSRAISRLHNLFSSSETLSLQTTPNSPSPTPSPASPTQTAPASPASPSPRSDVPGFFKKLTTRFTSSPQLNTPVAHNFHNEIDTLLPPPMAPPHSASNLTKIIHEIIATEWEYLGDLIALSDIQNMMLTHHVLEYPDAVRIFGNVEQILMANLELYRTFQKREWDCKQSTDQADLDTLAACIAEAFVAMAAYLRMYAAYSSKHEDSLKVITTHSERADFKVFLTQLSKQPVCKGLALAGLLIKPIQRVCKYPLLLRELLKYVDNPVTRPQIETAMAKIEETLLKVNEHQKMASRVEKMAKVLQELLDGGIDVEVLELASRRFVTQGSLQLIHSGKKTKDGHFYLFSDLFMWTRRTMGSLKLEVVVPLNEAIVTDFPTIAGEHGFELVHAGHKKWQFFVDKPEELPALKKLLIETIESKYSEMLHAT